MVNYLQIHLAQNFVNNISFIWKRIIKQENSFILNQRSSYLDKTSKNFYSYISEDGLPYSFTDLYGKFSIFSENGSKINLYGFNFEDNVDYVDLTNLVYWQTYLV